MMSVLSPVESGLVEFLRCKSFPPYEALEETSPSCLIESLVESKKDVHLFSPKGGGVVCVCVCPTT